MTSGVTFDLKEGLEVKPVHERDLVDFPTYLYNCKPVKKNKGKVLVVTDPTKDGGQCISPRFSNGFVGAIYQAYNEHRHLVLKPDDVWLAITTAFGLFINGGNNAEELRKHFVDFEGKIELTVTSGGTMYTVDWNDLINRMSGLIEKNTQKDTRKWIEPDFTTTTPVSKTVGQVVMMGVLKNYFDYKMCLMCGLPKVTLEGSLADWENIKERIAHLKSFKVECLTHWSSLLDFVLDKFIESFKGNVDQDFWSKIAAQEGWGSGPRYIAGWVNVFMPFSEKGEYNLSNANPKTGDWGKTDHNDVPPSTVEVPVKINDNGCEYDTIFYGGHIMCVYNPENNTVRPSLDWAIVDITGSTAGATSEGDMPGDVADDYNPADLPPPTKFVYGA